MRPPALSAPWREEAWRTAAVATLLLWLGSLVVVVAAAGTLPANPPVDVPAAPGFAGMPAPAVDASGGGLLGSALVRFDALWYLAIAADGYPATLEVPQAAAFFPGFPAVVAAVGALLGGRLVLAGQVVALLACVAALAGLHRLAALVVPGDEDLPRRVVVLTAVFPTAFFLVAPYAESLFLATSVWALVHAARRRPWIAATLAAVATCTRPVGILLVVPLLLGVLPSDPPPWWQRLVAAAGSVAALGAIAFHGWVQWGEPLAVASAQGAWERELTAPWTSVWLALRYAVEDLGAGFTGYHLLDLLVVGAAVGGLVVLALRRQWPLVAHAVANLGLWLTQVYPARPLLSAPRFAVVVPGMLLGLGVATRSTGRERVWLPVSAVLLGLHLALFSRWWYVF